jgi:hypothetical protein
MTGSDREQLLSVTGFWSAGQVTGMAGFVTLLEVRGLHILAGDRANLHKGFT